MIALKFIKNCVCIYAISNCIEKQANASSDEKITVTYRYKDILMVFLSIYQDVDEFNCIYLFHHR